MENKDSGASLQRLFSPPGGLVVWLFIFMEVCTFVAAFGVFAFQMKDDPVGFLDGQRQLDLRLGVINTLVLITSGYLAAIGVSEYHRRDLIRSSKWTLGAGLLGSVFVFLKLYEYSAKSAAGHSMGSSTFFSFYWALTGFHFLHVAVGVIGLVYMSRRLRSGKEFAEEDVTPETTAAFWHMCDLIWVILFPLMYLYR